MADLAAYWRGLRQFYDPRGRSSRTELFMLFILPGLFGTLALFVFGKLLSPRAEDAAIFAIWAVAIIPIPAAAARRFHDMGNSGWLSLPVLVLCMAALWNAWLDLQAGPYQSNDLWSGRPTLGLFYGLICLMFVIILMQPPRNANNPYGPDPRPEPKQI